jgi:hypothetical protein
MRIPRKCNAEVCSAIADHFHPNPHMQRNGVRALEILMVPPDVQARIRHAWGSAGKQCAWSSPDGVVVAPSVQEKGVNANPEPAMTFV